MIFRTSRSIIRNTVLAGIKIWLWSRLFRCFHSWKMVLWVTIYLRIEGQWKDWSFNQERNPDQQVKLVLWGCEHKSPNLRAKTTMQQNMVSRFKSKQAYWTWVIWRDSPWAYPLSCWQSIMLGNPHDSLIRRIIFKKVSTKIKENIVSTKIKENIVCKKREYSLLTHWFVRRFHYKKNIQKSFN